MILQCTLPIHLTIAGLFFCIWITQFMTSKLFSSVILGLGIAIHITEASQQLISIHGSQQSANHGAESLETSVSADPQWLAILPLGVSNSFFRNSALHSMNAPQLKSHIACRVIRKSFELQVNYISAFENMTFSEWGTVAELPKWVNDWPH